MRAIKRPPATPSAATSPGGTRAILAWDKAGIDFAYWFKVKISSGLHFISREKENMMRIRCGHRPFDRDDARNAGVVADENDVPVGAAGRPA